MNHLLTLAIVTVTALSVQAADWPLFRGNAEMTGQTDQKLPEKLTERWAFKTKSAIDSAPIIVDGVAYIPSTDRNLYAVNMDTGKEIWHVELEMLQAPPSYQDGRVYVGDIIGNFYCIDAKTGKKLWTFETLGEIHAGANFANDLIIIGSHDATLYALDKDGKKVWSMEIDGPVNGTAAIAGDKTFVAGCDSVLHVVDVKTGKSVGSVELGGQAACTAAVMGDNVYVGTMNRDLLGIDWKTLKTTLDLRSTSQPGVLRFRRRFGRFSCRGQSESQNLRRRSGHRQ